MKTRILSIAIILIGLSFIAKGTNAYYTAEETAHNVITSGNIDIEIIEMSETESGEFVAFEDAIGAMPGKNISKIVTVKNTGTQPAYIRVKLSQRIILANESIETGENSSVTCNINTDDWTEQDGYYYYNEALGAGDETVPLFTEVQFSKDMGNKYQNCKVELDVQAYATQVANNGEHVLEALGWPVE